MRTTTINGTTYHVAEPSLYVVGTLYGALGTALRVDYLTNYNPGPQAGAVVLPVWTGLPGRRSPTSGDILGTYVDGRTLWAIPPQR